MKPEGGKMPQEEALGNPPPFSAEDWVGSYLQGAGLNAPCSLTLFFLLSLNERVILGRPC